MINPITARNCVIAMGHLKAKNSPTSDVKFMMHEYVRLDGLDLAQQVTKSKITS